MPKNVRLIIPLVLVMLVCLNAGGCGSTVKKIMVDSLISSVKRESPLTQADMGRLTEMIRTRGETNDFSSSRKIYVVGKVATALVLEYSEPLARAGFNVQDLTVGDVLGLLDTVGIIDRKEYDYLLGVDLRIFDPLPQETELVTQNKTSLLLAVTQLALAQRQAK